MSRLIMVRRPQGWRVTAGSPTLWAGPSLGVRCRVVVVHKVQKVRRCRSSSPLLVASSRARARRAVAPCGAAPALARGRRRPQAPAVRQRAHQRPRVRAAAAQLARRRSPSRRCLLSGLSPVLLENRGSGVGVGGVAATLCTDPSLTALPLFNLLREEGANYSGAWFCEIGSNEPREKT